MTNCPFCTIPKDRLVIENDLAFAIEDGYPVTPGHALVIPKRHVVDYFGLSTEELLACHALVHELRTLLLDNDETIAGFNLGMNAGEVAGQTVFHSHIHVIPRRAGDVTSPRGGIRHLIPGKGGY
ncbi:HIT family protein [Haliea sp. E17]|uniref:HIT family protein n=1 Tax=Haliea sp. E17 TaxID=3401576 RepID=UPI003AAF304E